MKKERDLTTDCLKFVGLIGLLIAHISTNKFLLQLRNYDVNLLVILSAMLAFNSIKSIRNFDDRKKYYKKRFMRLVIPSWIFITFYLILNYFFGFVNYSITNVIRAYLFQDNSIGYVWIIYVYLICAILMPYIYKINFKNKKSSILFCVVSYLYILLYSISSNYYYRIIFLYPIVYGLISVLAINWDNFSQKKKRAFITINLIIFIGIAISKYKNGGGGEVVSIGQFKYPPKLYYLTYTLAISFFLIELFRKIRWKKNIFTRYITFISKSSLWFYLWHILVLQVSDRVTDLEVMQFAFVLIMTSCLIYIQNKIIDIFYQAGISKSILKIFKG